jgi:hypothetical protein
MENIVFTRQFRFLLEFDHMGPHFIHSVEWHPFSSIIRFKSYEVVMDGKVPIHEWAQDIYEGKLPDETGHLTALDGEGHAIYRRKFSGFKIISGGNSFDVGVNEPVLFNVSIKYQKCE